MALDLARLEEAPNLIDLLIQMEDVLDSLDIYVFANWVHGSVVSGPNVRRYWLQMTLEYPYDRKPDERGALRLVKHGLQCSMHKSQKGERRQAPLAAQGADVSAQTEEVEDTNAIWLVDLKIPRHLITDRNAGQIDFYDEEDEIDAEDVQDASDAGMTDETGVIDQQAAPDQAPAAPEDPNAAPQ